MTRTETPRRRSPAARQKMMERRLAVASRVLAVVVGVLAVVLVVVLATSERSPQGAGLALPNPMGGAVVAAPYAVGEAVDVGALQVAAPDVEMGQVPLEVTVVARWEVVNTSSEAQQLVIGQPQVLEGCCPGPVYVDDAQVAAGSSVEVAAGSSVMVQFPLQMHAGMDGPHHLVVPVESGGEQRALHVTGDFTDRA